jgi:P-type Ca2+ transporter type 2C
MPLTTPTDIRRAEANSPVLPPMPHRLEAVAVADALGVDPTTGLPTEEVERRRRVHGPNLLAETPPRSRWAILFDQFRNLLIVVLIGAAVLAGLVGDVKDMVVIGVVLVINALLGFLQEVRAERSLAALKAMLVARARVRRDGAVVEIDAADLVPGDIVLLDAGDRVPADGRILGGPGMEVDESTLTGESTPVAKTIEALTRDLPLADRRNLVFMNTVVTRGRGEVLVTTTGMGTEVGRIAGLLDAAEAGDTPLQVQLHALGRRLALVAAAAVTVFATLSLLRGESLADTVLASVALAVAAIPEGLPAVVTVTLAIGTSQMAKRGAIVKRLASVETLGATSVICSDKTGTLTLNEMTVQELWLPDGGQTVSGRGYEQGGEISPGDGAGLTDVLTGLVRCNDSHLVDGRPVGDPMEAALLVLATKGGLDPAVARTRADRVAEVPFDSAHKFMATVHRVEGELRLEVKGAPDVLLARCPSASDAERAAMGAEVERMAAGGMRVIALATRPLTDAELAAVPDPLRLVDDLRITALVGLVDPPRPEAAEAIALCRRAGVGVKMITGDHAATARAIATDLGIRGEVVTGAEIDQLDDDELAARIPDIGVVARVSPDHKVRLVRVLQANGEVVAMTGDGVNDAPALKTADIGVAMGITGTEVSKEAASMVLTDDNFATIVTAVERGRTIYDNIVKFVRFQLSTNLGAISTLIGAQLVGLPVPFTALQVLWVNLIMDGPPAMALGVDPPSGDTMSRTPRHPEDRILRGRRLRVLVGYGAVMAVGTLGVLAWAMDNNTEAHALSLAFTTFVMFQVFNVFNARAEDRTMFTRDLFTNKTLWAAVMGVVVLQVLAVTVDPFQEIFGTVDLDVDDWLVAVGVASSIIWLDELRKLVRRLRRV